MNLLKPDTVYRSVDLVFDTQLDGILKRLSDDVKKLFAENKFRHATITIDVRNPSKEPMFK